MNSTKIERVDGLRTKVDRLQTEGDELRTKVRSLKDVLRSLTDKTESGKFDFCCWSNNKQEIVVLKRDAVV